jgi:hypothetical protein
MRSQWQRKLLSREEQLSRAWQDYSALAVPDLKIQPAAMLARRANHKTLQFAGLS